MIATVLALLAAGPNAVAAPRLFRARSHIDRFDLRGQVDLPVGRPRAVVIMFPGSGTHDRDMRFGGPGKERPKVFKQLSERLTEAGFATVRYDERGIGCYRPNAKPDASGRCFNDVDAEKIDWGTLFSDAAAIYKVAKQAPGGWCVIALGHSEGLVHVANLIAAHAARPRGVIAIGGPFGSLDGPLRWQRVQMVPRAIAASDLNGDGVTSRSELAANLVHTPLSRYGDFTKIPWPAGFVWPDTGMNAQAIAALQAKMQDAFDVFARDVLSHDDAQPVTTPLADGTKGVIASYGWFKPFFRTSPPVVDAFASFKGDIAAFFGGIDGNIDAEAEARTLRAAFPAERLFVDSTPDVGHTLGTNATYGPMRPDREAAIVAAAVRIASRRCEK